MSARSSLVWGYSCCRLFGFQARHTSLPVTLPSCYSPRHTNGNNTVGAGLGTADCGRTSRGTGNEKSRRNEGLLPHFPRSYLNVVHTWLSRLVSHRSLRMSWFQEQLTMLSLCEAATHLRALCRCSCLGMCDVRVSPARTSPPALPAPEDGKSA